MPKVRQPLPDLRPGGPQYLQCSASSGWSTASATRGPVATARSRARYLRP